MVEYLPRSAWTSAPRGGATLTARKLVGVSAHYPGDGNLIYRDLTRAQVADKLRAYRNYHVNVKKWSDIGYQVAGDQSGRIWDLRGITRVPAASASPANPDANLEYGAFLFVIGNSEMPTPALIAAFQHWRFNHWLKQWPNATDLDGHGYGNQVGRPDLAVPGARTACPGSRVHGLIANGVLLRRPGSGGGGTAPPAKPAVDLSKLREAARVDPPRTSDKARYPTGTRRVEGALVAEGLLDKRYRDPVGHFGSKTVEAYARWQRRLGYTGRDADGIPGRVSLTELGRRHGFRVVP